MKGRVWMNGLGVVVFGVFFLMVSNSLADQMVCRGSVFVRERPAYIDGIYTDTHLKRTFLEDTYTEENLVISFLTNTSESHPVYIDQIRVYNAEGDLFCNYGVTDEFPDRFKSTLGPHQISRLSSNSFENCIKPLPVGIDLNTAPFSAVIDYSYSGVDPLIGETTRLSIVSGTVKVLRSTSKSCEKVGGKK